MLLFAFFSFVLFLVGLFLDLLIVVSWSQRGGDIPAKWNGDQVGCIGIHPGIIEVAVDWPEGPVGQKIEILPLRIKAGESVGIVPGSHLMDPAIPRVVQVDGTGGAVPGLGVGEPAGARGPGHGEAAQSVMRDPLPTIDFPYFGGLNIEQAEDDVLVNESDLPAVG